MQVSGSSINSFFFSIDISTGAQGYGVDKANILQKPLGIEIPLVANGNYSVYGTLIQNLVVDIVYETNERIHVKVIEIISDTLSIY